MSSNWSFGNQWILQLEIPTLKWIPWSIILREKIIIQIVWFRAIVRITINWKLSEDFASLEAMKIIQLILLFRFWKYTSIWHIENWDNLCFDYVNYQKQQHKNGNLSLVFIHFYQMSFHKNWTQHGNLKNSSEV